MTRYLDSLVWRTENTRIMSTDEAVQIKKRRKGGNKRLTYGTYIYKILKSVHPNLGIGTGGVMCLNGLAEDLEARLTAAAGKYAKFQKKNTLSSKHIMVATNTILPGDLAGHAVAEGTKAVTRYMAD